MHLQTVSEIVNQRLQKIAKGTGIIYFRGKKEEKVFKCKEKITFC